MDTGKKKEGEGGVNGESSLETYMLLHVNQMAGGSLLYDSRNSNQGSVTTRRGGMGGWFMLIYDKNQHNIVKQLFFS